MRFKNLAKGDSLRKVSALYRLMPISQRLALWRQMSRPSLLRLSLAVFLIVGALGPVMILMQSEIKLMPWYTIALQTF